MQLGAQRRGTNLVTSSELSAIAGVTYPQQMPFVTGTMAFTLGAPADVVGITAAMLIGGGGFIALGGAGSTTDGGYVAAVEAAFAAGAPTAGTTQRIDDLRISNVVMIKSALTDDIVETPNGEEVFGLLHAANGSVDGAAIAFGGATNLQISFAYRTLADPSVLANYTLPAGTYYFAPRLHTKLSQTPYSASGGGDIDDLAQGGPDSVKRTVVNVANYDTTQTDSFLAVTRTLTGACAIRLMSVDAVDGRRIAIVDEGLNAGAFNITITTEGAELIQGGATFVINRDGNGVNLYSDGTNWFIGD